MQVHLLSHPCCQSRHDHRRPPSSLHRPHASRRRALRGRVGSSAYRVMILLVVLLTLLWGGILCCLRCFIESTPDDAERKSR